MIKHEIRTCAACGALQTVKVKKPNHILHLVLSVCTGGVWLIIYLAAMFESVVKMSAKCVKCKSKIK